MNSFSRSARTVANTSPFQATSTPNTVIGNIAPPVRPARKSVLHKPIEGKSKQTPLSESTTANTKNALHGYVTEESHRKPFTPGQRKHRPCAIRHLPEKFLLSNLKLGLMNDRVVINIVPAFKCLKAGTFSLCMILV